MKNSIVFGVGILMILIPITVINIYFAIDCREWSCLVHTTDENGVYMIDYKNYEGANIGKVYNPNFISEILWFEEHLEDHGDYYMIPYEYPWPLINSDGTTTIVQPPFYSCEAQGKGMHLALSEYENTGDEKYKDMAYKFYHGMIDTELTNDYWIQGFYHKDIGGTSILNSQMYCLINIYGMYERTNDPEIKEFFDRGIERLEQDIDYYTVVNGTVYDKHTKFFKPHSEHPDYADILKWLQERSDSEKLAQVHEEWLT